MQAQPYFQVLNEMKKQKITQKEMADTLGINVSTFNHKVNRTNGSDFSFSQAKQVAIKLKMKPSLLFLQKSCESETKS